MNIVFENCQIDVVDENTAEITAPQLAGRYESDEVIVDVAWDATNHALVKTSGKLILDITDLN